VNGLVNAFAPTSVMGIRVYDQRSIVFLAKINSCFLNAVTGTDIPALNNPAGELPNILPGTSVSYGCAD
jgi:hypothetical protein